MGLDLGLEFVLKVVPLGLEFGLAFLAAGPVIL